MSVDVIGLSNRSIYWPGQLVGTVSLLAHCSQTILGVSPQAFAGSAKIINQNMNSKEIIFRLLALIR